MGLAGRKQKQRIPADPRNLSWADDASRFGLSYLSKFGWDASQGLGSSGDGMKTHIKVQQKLDMMGIGSQHQRDPNGIAWKQNKEFEALLKRLNESAAQEKGAGGEDMEGEGVKVQGTAMGKAFIRAREENVEGKLGNESESVTTKKRKHKDRDDPDASENSRKKRKEEGEEKEKRQKSSSDSDSAVPAIDPASGPSSALSPLKPPSEPIPRSRPMAHRARIRAAKRISGKSASAIAEILGIARSPPMSTESTPTPASTPPSSSAPTPQASLSLDNLTTSTKSVADYFKEKLLARSSSSPASSSAPSGYTTPGLCPIWPGLGLTQLDDEEELPRRGIGSRAPAVPPPSRVPEAESASGGGDTDGDSRDMLTEKQRRKAERKAEKRKQREAEASQAIVEDVSTVVKKKEEDDAESGQRSSKKEKKRLERKQPLPANQTDDNDNEAAEKKHEHPNPSGSLPDPNKKPKKELKKNRS